MTPLTMAHLSNRIAIWDLESTVEGQIGLALCTFLFTGIQDDLFRITDLVFFISRNVQMFRLIS